jgi:hypothetical protein
MKIKNKTSKDLKLEVYSICPGEDSPIYGTLTLKEGKEIDSEFPLDELRIKE